MGQLVKICYAPTQQLIDRLCLQSPGYASVQRYVRRHMRHRGIEHGQHLCRRQAACHQSTTWSKHMTTGQSRVSRHVRCVNTGYEGLSSNKAAWSRISEEQLLENVIRYMSVQQRMHQQVRMHVTAGQRMAPAHIMRDDTGQCCCMSLQHQAVSVESGYLQSSLHWGEPCHQGGSCRKQCLAGVGA